MLTKNVEVQLEQLIVASLKRVKNKLDTTLILVIDGLDEANKGENDQTLFLWLLDSSFLSHDLRLKIIVTSRPEPWIKDAFGDSPSLGSAQSHFLQSAAIPDRPRHFYLSQIQIRGDMENA